MEIFVIITAVTSVLALVLHFQTTMWHRADRRKIALHEARLAADEARLASDENRLADDEKLFREH